MVVFKEESDYHKYLELIHRFKQLLPFNLYHYCLMPNHVHLLIQTNNAREFSSFMQRLNLAYYNYFNRKYSWQGHFWQNRYRSQSVGKDEYFIQCGKYIELNPVRANIVTDPVTYQFSSFRHYVLGEKNNLINEDLFYEGLGKSITERRDAYRKLVVSDLVLKNYNRDSWGSSSQQYNERRKRRRKYRNLTK